MLKTWMANFLRKVMDVSVHSQFLDSENEIKREILAAQYLAPLSGPYLPWSRAALAPSAIATILNDIIINNRQVIVEFGGGISTIYIARLLAKHNSGKLITVEHDLDWLKILQDMLDAEKISERVSLVHAPLTEI
jgi:hypothetical protein